MFRGPTSTEEGHYRLAIQMRNEEEFAGLFDLYPDVAWGNVTESLSAEDKAWVQRVLQRKREQQDAGHGYWDHEE